MLDPHMIIEYQISRIRYQVLKTKYQISSKKYHISSIIYQVSYIKYQLSSIKYQVTSVKYQITRDHYSSKRFSNIDTHKCNFFICTPKFQENVIFNVFFCKTFCEDIQKSWKMYDPCKYQVSYNEYQISNI